MSDQVSEFLWRLKTYTFVAADAVDRQADLLAAAIRDSLEWLPEGARPAPRRVVVPETPLYVGGGGEGWWWWWLDDKWTAGIVVAGAMLGIGGYGYMRRRKYQKKRRAKKAGNGGRREVVGLWPSPYWRVWGNGIWLMYVQ
jgi:hypothetical protein